MSEWIAPNGQEYHVWFDSMEELRKQIVKMQSRRNADRWSEILYRGRSSDWFGMGMGTRDALQAVEDGCPELLQQVKPLVEILRASVPLDGTESVMVEVRRRKRHRSDYGDTLDMHRVWSGELDRAWERPVREVRLSATQRYASIYVDNGILRDVKPRQTLWRAAVAMLIADVLTRMGINVEIWAGASGFDTYTGEHGSAKFRWSGVRAKEYTQPLNEERVCAVMHAMFHRTYGFGMTLAAPWAADDGMGYSYDSGLVKPLRDRQGAGERVFRIGKCLDEAQAIIEVRRVIEVLKPKEREPAHA